MKKLFFLLFLFAATAAAQVFDEPIDSTSHYAFRLYAQSARVPNTILNEDKEKIDSLIYALIVWVDSSQLILISDPEIAPSPHLVLKISNYATGLDQFSGTLTADTFTVAGTDTLVVGEDLFWIQPYSATITSNDIMAYTILSPNKVRVVRPASGTSGLLYRWRWIRRY
jgi:hypothetical protein